MDIGEGVRSFEIHATRDGRRLEVNTSRGTVEVAEVTRSGRTVRSARFMATRVVAIVEHPAAEGDERPEPRPRKRQAPENQPPLL